MLQPLVKKELRLATGPIWLTVISSIILMLLAWDKSQALWNPVVTWLGFGAICSYVIVSQFGSEISLNCLEWGISQPWSRSQYWKQKIRIALVIYGFIALVMVGMVHWFHRGDISRGSISLEVLALPLVVAFWACLGPGIYLVLKYRNMVASMWLTCLLPIGLALLIAYPLEISQVSSKITVLVVTFAEFLYGTLGLWLAWRTFLKWEATGNGSADISLPTRQTASKGPKQHAFLYRPVRMAFIREWKLQKTNLLLAAGCVFCCAFILGLNKALPIDEWFGKEFSGVLSLLPEFFRWVVFLFPCTMACMSIAEARRFDVHTTELVSPMSRRIQLCIKVFSVMFLGWLVAVVLPSPLDPFLYENLKNFGKAMMLYFWLSLLVFFIASVCIYTSSFSSSLLKGFTSSLVVFSLLPALGFAAARLGVRIGGSLTVIIPVVIGLCFLYWRTFRNWCCPNPSRSLVSLNGIQCTAVLTICFMLGWIVEDRSWERWTMTEPTKEASILKPGVQPSAQISWGRHEGYSATVLSPDGSIWLVKDPNNDSHTFGDGNQVKAIKLPILPPKGYWIRLRSGFWRVALDSEHRLWKWNPFDEENWNPVKGNIQLEELGKGRKWSTFDVSGLGHTHLIAIAEDGSLWNFSQTYDYEKKQFDPIQMIQVDAEPPTHQELGSGNKTIMPISREVAYDWVDCLSKGRLNFALNSKGTLFAWGKADSLTAWNRRYIPENQLVELIDLSEYRAWFIQHISGDEKNAIIVTTNDGSQWVAGKSLRLGEDSQGSNPNFPTMYQIKTDQKILNLTQLYLGRYLRPTFRKADGTLWESTQLKTGDPDSKALANNSDGRTIFFSERQIGKRDDWVFNSGTMGITADGKIWNWNNTMQGQRIAGLNMAGWLPPRFRHKVIADLDP